MKYLKIFKTLEGGKGKVVVFLFARMTRKFQKVITFEMTNNGPCKKGLKIMLFSPIRVSPKRPHSDETSGIVSNGGGIDVVYLVCSQQDSKSFQRSEDRSPLPRGAKRNVHRL
jgi:hypothetical protein